MNYGIKDKPKTIKEWILYTLQMVLSVFCATVLISNICGTPVNSCLLGACLATLIYEIITGFKSPMFISSCGATVSAVIGALALPSIAGQNYLMVAVGGIIIAIVYAIFAALYKTKGADFINKLLPPSIVGAITIVIGLNLAKFLPTYTHNSNTWEVVVGISVMFVVALTSHYFKGFLKTIPFLFGILFGYAFCLVLKIFNIDIISFEAFKHMQWYPDFTFLKWHVEDFSWINVGKTILLFLPVALCAICEHISDHKVLGNIIEKDLISDPGLDKTLLGNGAASVLGTVVGGLPQTSYGEGISTIGFSKVASVYVTMMAALFLGVLSFLAPVNAFIQTIPSCVFSGAAMVLYGYIAASGLKTLYNNKVDLEDNKNLTIVSVVLCVGISGMFLFTDAFAGVSLAMVLGIILNIVLKNEDVKTEKIANSKTQTKIVTLTEEEYKEVLENSVYCKPLIVRKMGIFCTILLSILLLVTLIVLIF